jgi:hypothetical protein
MTQSKWCFSLIAVIVLCITAACGSVSSATGSSSTVSTSNVPVPFGKFLQGVSNARYSDYTQRTTTKVQNAQAFEEMRLYVLKLYTGVRVVSTYVANGQSFDCVVSTSKQGPPPASAPTQIAGSTPIGQSNAANSTACKPGTIPMQRITLDQLVQFATLQAFLTKSPGGSSLPPVPPAN